MNIRPLSDRIVVQPLDPAAVTPGGILLPDSAQGRATKGKVIGVGPGKLVPSDDGSVHRIAMQVAVGDVVLFTPYAGSEIDISGIEVRILSESDILGVLEGGES
jgi:chaperonin GroES